MLWAITCHWPANGNETFTYTYEGKDEKQMDKLKVGTALTYSPPAATEPTEGLPFKIKEAKLTTKEGTGDVRFDSVKGRLDSSTMKLVLEGTLTIEIGGMATPVDLKQEPIDLGIRRQAAIVQHAAGQRLRPLQDQVVIQQIQRLRRRHGILAEIAALESIG